MFRSMRVGRSVIVVIDVPVVSTALQMKSDTFIHDVSTDEP